MKASDTYREVTAKSKNKIILKREEGGGAQHAY